MIRALALLALAGCTQIVKFEQIPESSAQCTDLVDNDGDELIDCADPDCQRLPLCEGASLCRWEGITQAITVPLPVALVAARIDDDQRIDVVVASRAGELRELRNDGTLLVAQAPVAVTGATITGLAAASLESTNTAVDLVVLDGGANPAAVRLVQAGGGSFTATPLRVALPAAPSAIVLGNLDGDGDIDGFVSGSGAPSYLANDGRGGLSATTPDLPAPPGGIALGDINRDQRLDLVYITRGAAQVRVLLQGGTAAFPFTIGQPFTGGIGPSAVLVGDLDATGGRDLVIADAGNDTLGVYVEQGNAMFMGLSPVPLAGDPRAFASGDIDGDGALDLVVATPAAVLIFLGDGVGGFDEIAPRFAVADVRAVAVTDIDGDGHDDLVLAETDANRVTVARSRTTNCD